MSAPLRASILRASARLLLTFGLLAGGPAAAAEILGGRVTDAETGLPLVSANVYVQGRTTGTVSTAGGYFTLRNPPLQLFTLVVTYVGYAPALLKVDPTALAPGQELSIALQPVVYTHEEIVVSASRYSSDLQLTHTNIPGDEIEREQTMADIPLLLENVPGVYASSDAGNGVGYTYLQIRGFDQRRIGVLVNGVPLNDPEDQQVYWVDLPDLASSLEDIQVQRGVTNSLGGMPSLGGTVNLLTDVLPVEPGGRISLQYGSYDTAKQTLLYNTGFLGGRFASGLRISHLESDGYRDRSGSVQWAVFWSGRYVTPRSATDLYVWTGRELTQQAWYGIDEATLARDRKANPETYYNAVDDFRQPQVQLHHTWDLSDRLSLRNTLFWIHGVGYYENFKADALAHDYSLDYHLGLAPAAEVDLVRRKWVRKDQVGWSPQLAVEHAGGRLLIGGDAYTFHSDHWGEVMSVEGFTSDQLVGGLKYHDYTGDKEAWSVYLNDHYEVAGGLTALVDLQYQYRTYDFAQDELANFRGLDRQAYSVNYEFFNPKGGLHWRLPGTVAGGEMALYVHVGVARREPADSDLFDTWQGPDDLGVAPLFRRSRVIYRDDGVTVDHVEWSDPIVQEEKVVDWEVGTTFRSGWLSATLNGYWMDFNDEIVPYGTVDAEGFGVRGNADQTLHRGVELGLTAQPAAGHLLNLAASRSWDEFDRFIFHDWDGTPLDYSGHPIALFPQHMVTLRWRATWGGLQTELRLRRIGKQYLDDTGDEERTIDPYETVDLACGFDLARLGFGGWEGARVELRLRNLLDAKYETSGYYDGWGAGNYKIPAATRNFLLGVHYDF
jgi:iron complex outermembrane receptor protein